MDYRSSSAHALLDSAHLHRYTGGDTGLEIELYSLLRGQIHSTLEALEKAGDDEQLWRRLVHTLKGAARGVGAMALGEACAAAENRPLDPQALGEVREMAGVTVRAIGEALRQRKAA
ncbi:MAG: Hpt domain-containing protein [Oceanicaulis sp.]|uniref:Hpt domain-containing protein n=1 Tax=Glycocaulis sp. TaxID=1969725 RepID=UPI0025BEDBA2|nr:Hpt domain-containing protein [Glycocaulis sp.]MCC5982440.1 Hpt domain-containing protein [Oceanicaulis sp.]MCH8520454.1 Hpt domain-containing protein [Glycocaulis sp.]